MITAAAVAPFCGAGSAPPSLFGNNTSSQNLPVAFNNVGGSDNALANIDYHMNDRNTLNGEFFYGNGKVNNATATSSPYWLANNVIPTKTGRVVWVWTPKSNIVNEMRFGVCCTASWIIRRIATRAMERPITPPSTGTTWELRSPRHSVDLRRLR